MRTKGHFINHHTFSDKKCGIDRQSFDPKVGDNRTRKTVEANFAGFRPIPSSCDIKLDLSEKQIRMLEQLVKTGLYGSSIGEVAEQLIMAALRSAWRDGLLMHEEMRLEGESPADA